jgi:acetamidase/formamidase
MRPWAGLHSDYKDLDQPSGAMNAMLDIIVRLYDVTRSDALALASLVVDVHVTQMVNGARGIHTVLPHGAIQ